MASKKTAVEIIALQCSECKRKSRERKKKKNTVFLVLRKRTFA